MSGAPASQIARESAAEIEAALRAKDAPRWAQLVMAGFVRVASRRLGEQLCDWDADIGRRGLASASARFLNELGARTLVLGKPPARGALLAMNHPGAYDALATMSALERDDVLFLARSRPFLEALPNLAKHLAFVGAAGFKRAVRHITAGGVVVQLGAGAIEPDARFDRGDLAPWPTGATRLASLAHERGAAVVPAFVSGVHSRRAKRLWISRWSEARGITTIAPLIQATMPGFRDVEVHVRFGKPVARHAELRDAVRVLGPRDFGRAGNR